MGDMADWARENGEMDHWDVQKELAAMSDAEIVKEIEGVFSDPGYVEGEFTPMIGGIISNFYKNKNLTSIQRNALSTHLSYNARIWY